MPKNKERARNLFKSTPWKYDEDWLACAQWHNTLQKSTCAVWTRYQMESDTVTCAHAQSYERALNTCRIVWICACTRSIVCNVHCARAQGRTWDRGSIRERGSIRGQISSIPATNMLISGSLLHTLTLYHAFYITLHRAYLLFISH